MRRRCRSTRWVSISVSRPAFTPSALTARRPVQGAVIPIALEGHDVVACAETGTGKTLAFAAPIIELLLSESPGYGDAARENYTRALILAPTRELAVQIEDSLVGLTYHTPVTSAAGVRRRRDGTAGTRAAGRRRHRRRHAGTADGSHAPQQHRLRARAVPGAGRSRSHDGHGLLARRPEDHVGAAAGSPDAALLRHAAGRDPADGEGDAEGRRATCRSARRAARRGRSITRWCRSRAATRSTGWRRSPSAMSDGPVLVFVRRKIDADKRDAAPGREEHPGGGAACRSLAAGTAVGGRRVPVGQASRAGRHRHCRARPRHRGHRARDQFRSARFTGDLRAPRRTHRPLGRIGTRGDVGVTA